MTKIACKGLECKNNCCLAFDGISERISPFSPSVKFSDIILSSDDYNLIVQNGYSDYLEINANGLMKLRTSSNGACSAFVNGKCGIYSCRPMVCRAYPFYIDMFAGLCTINDCCAAPDDYSISKYAEEIRSVISVYRAWIEYYESVLQKSKEE